jgi:hypothetical protein
MKPQQVERCRQTAYQFGNHDSLTDLGHGNGFRLPTAALNCPMKLVP